jgi:hypothetical protein
VSAKALNVDAQLSLVSDRGAAVAVTANGATISVGIPSLWMATRYGRRLNRRRRLALFGQAHQWLTRADLMVEFRIRDHTLALLGPHAQPGLLSRLTGLHPLELRVRAILRSLFGRG